ncbi:MAG: hypothetical protein ACLR0F_16260 [Eisenbergiella sp.]
MEPAAAGVTGSAILGILLLAGDLILSGKLRSGKGQRKIPQLLVVMVVSGLAVTTVNTVILRETIGAAWKTIPFLLLWMPRAAEELLSNIVLTYFIAVLLSQCGREL